MVRRRIKKGKEKDEEMKGNPDEAVQPKSYLSVKDSVVIISLSTLLSISLVTATLGINGISERLSQHGLLDILLTFAVFICLFGLVSYLLVKFACHYLVYFAIGTFFAIIFPVSKRKQREAVKEIYDKAERR